MRLVSLLLPALLAATSATAQDRRFHAYSIESTSMEPTLQIDERVPADRQPDDCGDVDGFEPGDIVIRRRGEQRWISRIVAGPEQTVEMRSGLLMIDGRPVNRSSDGRTVLAGREGEIFTETLPNGRAYQTFQHDGVASVDDMPGLALGPSQWFLMGDNRRNAVDSRIDGPIGSVDLCGLVTHLYLSQDPSRVRALR